MIRTILFSFWLALFASLSPVLAEDIPPPADPDVRHYLKIPQGGLADFLRRPVFPVPIISFHRGGPAPGFPENAIETMDNALAYGYGVMEVDVAQLKDGTLILMHDNTLGRTTTGEGPLRQHTWETVKNLRLKDSNGHVTDFRVPLLKDVLKWAVGRTILTLDIKRGVDFAKVAKMVQEAGAEDYSVAISYTMDQAKAFHRLAPNMPLTIGLGSTEDLTEFDSSGIPENLVMAWTGTRLRPPEHYRTLHARGMRVIVGTLGRPDRSIDYQILRGESDVSYRDIVKMGADIIATDRFWAVQSELLNPNLFILAQFPNCMR